jgi:redox-sensitive bicupin YhaK (pirin superfamily)
MDEKSVRPLRRVIRAINASDGAGVRLRRSLGQSQDARVDPFLMLDEFGTDNPDDYIAGFPPHPHRGFETVTYMLEGHMRHRDHLGNQGDLTPGSVQWMTAGRGIVHSEMPQQTEGRMRGFQLWINLPAAEKMKAASYRDIPPADIPSVALAGGATAKVIAGTVTADGRSVSGPVRGITTEPLFIDVRLPSGAAFSQAVADGHSAFVYVYAGSLEVAPGSNRKLSAHEGGVLGESGRVEVQAGADGAHFLLLAAKPLREPVVQYGPFVMNTQEEIEQAIRDYQAGTFA